MVGGGQLGVRVGSGFVEGSSAGLDAAEAVDGVVAALEGVQPVRPSRQGKECCATPICRLVEKVLAARAPAGEEPLMDGAGEDDR